MKSIDTLKDWFKDKKLLVDENEKIKSEKKTIESKLNQVCEDYFEVNKKYTELLEKSNYSLNLYIEYQDKCAELTADKRVLKRENANQLETINELMLQRDEAYLELDKLKKKKKRTIKKVEKQ